MFPFFITDLHHNVTFDSSQEITKHFVHESIMIWMIISLSTLHLLPGIRSYRLLVVFANEFYGSLID